MTGTQEIQRDAAILAETAAGPILEISFRGKHWDGCGNDMIDFVRESVTRWKPAAVLVNLEEFKYAAGNDVGALLFPLLDKQTRRFRTFSIVATGRTARSLQDLFELTEIPELSNAPFFVRRSDALTHLERHLDGGAD